MIALNDFIQRGTSSLGVIVGMNKAEIEAMLGGPLGEPDIESTDVSSYLLKMNDGMIWTVNFDNNAICYEIKLDFDENQSVDCCILIGDRIEKMNYETTFDSLIAILNDLNIAWSFDTKRMYMQTVCIRLPNSARLFYAFGNKNIGDYGLFSLCFLLESHPNNIRD